MANNTILQKMVAVETMEDDDIKKKYGTSRSNVKKVLRVLLLDELLEEQKEAEKEDENEKPRPPRKERKAKAEAPAQE